MTPKRPHRNYPIRPAPTRDILPSGRHGSVGALQSPIVVPAKRRGPQTTLACDACRTRKTKCDGRKPCEACRSKNSQCHYDKEGREKNKTSALRSQIADLQAIVKRFSDGSDEEAADIRRRLREDSLSRVAKDLCSDTFFDSTESERSTTPESISLPQKLPSIDFMASAQKNTMDFGWRVPTKLELFRIARRRAMLDTVSSDMDEDSGEFNFSISIPRACNFSTAFQQIPLVRRPSNSCFQFKASKASIPYLAARSPLNSLVSNAFVSQLLCLWLSYHAFSNPYIQPTDLVSKFEYPRGESETLLQNSLLALSCLYLPQSSHVSHTEMARYFQPEAERIWQSQKGRASTSSVQALIAQYEYEKMFARDRVGWHSLSIAMDMAQDIGLHSIHGDWGSEGVDDSEAFAAWGIFNHQAIESLTFCKPPQILRCWTGRPKKIIPSQITDSWRPFCISEENTNSSFWDHWEALCNLTDIIVDATYLLYGDQIDGFETPCSVLVAQTQHSRYRVNEWRQRLPSTLWLSNNETPHNLWLHMLYYSLMIALHRPYVEDPRISSEEPRDVVFHSRNIMIESARNIVHLAMISLERYTPEFSPAHNIQMLGTAAFVLVQDLDDGESRADLLSCLTILHLQSHRFLLAAALTRAILLVAWKNEPEAYGDFGAALRENLAAASGRKSATTRLADHVYSSFPTFSAGCKRRRPGGWGLSDVLKHLEGQAMAQMLGEGA